MSEVLNYLLHASITATQSTVGQSGSLPSLRVRTFTCGTVLCPWYAFADISVHARVGCPNTNTPVSAFLIRGKG
jgi:hypothetical protein